MSDSVPAPGSTDSAAPAPGSSSAVGEGSSASAGVGNAPDSGVDAVGGEATPGVPAVAPTPKFTFAGREWPSQQRAEDAYRANLGRQWEGKLTEAQKVIAARDAELSALRNVLVSSGGGGRGQGIPRDQGSSDGPRSFAKELAEGGELDIIAKIFADPEMGPGHAMYRMAELFDKRQQEQVGQVREEILGQFHQTQVRSQQEHAVARAIGVARNLVSDYPELDQANETDEAIEAQQGIIEIIKALPQGAEWLASDPEEALRYAAEKQRRRNGTPMFAQPPGTSGSPSVRAAHAAEVAAAGSASVPLDGSGVPRQRPSGRPETFADRVRRENRELSQGMMSPSGRPLGF